MSKKLGFALSGLMRASIFPVFRVALREGSIQSRRAIVSHLFIVYRAAFREISIRYRRYMARFGAVRKLLTQMPSDE
ncbi:hypothetical protein Ecod37b_18800 [Escherichia coli str. K-12 substr. MG1655]|nr:hypothetical protein Ecod33a_20140 [Escherichia coli str. K-12 substr. MG1655]BDZ11081.1 hypothetical protein Ecod33b_20210 [Escherichia coli str. K-12 substr. MG1655]BDZ13563.1 hypothetical protein Ecod37b_18800 [Escherichia coli str. K-12 substr. MG1655]BDZ16025.1 hypothetical protein Ecod37c13_18870 [Escherichia coli str. K-12 substr. MG1655]BDZ18486.1 hypothetical protein Ecod37c143_18810 [Escherichia coli str. K-12 substr. MG1655]